uniref:Uncharacterized protein n=1 Tax=Anopheles atroparvus TaxID=41427 RepID=A0A182J0C0_ANOAO
MRLVAAEERHVVTGMARDRVLDDEREPDRGGQYVATHQLRPKQRRQQIPEHVLDRMRVDGGPGDRCRELVVLLVDQPVQVLGVEQPSRRPLEQIHEDEERSQHPVERVDVERQAPHVQPFGIIAYANATRREKLLLMPL